MKELVSASALLTLIVYVFINFSFVDYLVVMGLAGIWHWLDVGTRSKR